MRLQATIRNWGSDVKSNDYVVEVRLNGRLLVEKSFPTVKKCRNFLEQEFEGANVTEDFIYQKETKRLLREF